MAPKAKSKSKTATTTAPEPAQAAPNWPSLASATSSEDLTTTVLLPNQILTIPSLFPRSLSKTFTTFLRTLPLTTTPGKPQKGHAVRVNDRYQVTDPAFAHALYTQTGLQTIIEHTTHDTHALSSDEKSQLWGGAPLGLNPNIRIYRYGAGQFFDKHYDDSNDILFPVVSGGSEAGKTVPARTTWTLLIYLSGPETGCVGGETVFYPEAETRKGKAPVPVEVGLQVGLAVLHRHGRECLLHEGRGVMEGEKWVIRSDVCVRR